MRRWLPLPLLLLGCDASPPERPIFQASFGIGPLALATSPSPTPAPSAPTSPALPPPSPTPSPPSGHSGGGSPAAPVPTPAPVGLGVCEEVAENAGIVATLAGGRYGYADGAFTDARFRSAYGVAVDGSGRLYVADTGNRAVRRLAPDGTVITLAGGPDQGALQEPRGIAAGSDGTIYVSDTARNALYRLGPEGALTLLAGGGQGAHVDGVGAAARFDDPRGLAVDADGNLLVADMNNHCIRRVTPSGEVTTFAGSGAAGTADGPGTAASFMSPIGVAIAPDGQLYVADIVAHRIRRISPGGTVSTFAGAGTTGDADGPGTTAQFASPWAITADARGTLYVVDGEQASRVRRVTPDGHVTTLAGAATPGYRNGVGAQTRFFSAFGLAASGCGRLYMLDGFCRVREIH